MMDGLRGEHVVVSVGTHSDGVGACFTKAGGIEDDYR